MSLETETLSPKADKFDWDKIDLKAIEDALSVNNTELPHEEIGKAEIQDVFDKTESDDAYIQYVNDYDKNLARIKDFFESQQQNNIVYFKADCEPKLMEIIKNQGLKFLIKKGCLGEISPDETDDTVCSEADGFETLLGEVIKDSIYYGRKSQELEIQKSENPQKPGKTVFYVKISINHDDPKKFSFLIMNSCKIRSEEFKDYSKDNGFGNKIKLTQAEELGANIINLDIISENNTKEQHGVLFERKIYRNINKEYNV